jgi:hypothetical protein
MKAGLVDVFAPQLVELLAEYDALRARARCLDLSDLPADECVRFVTRARAAITRIAGFGSPYAIQCEEIIRERDLLCFTVTQLRGVLSSLQADLQAGFLKSASQLVRGELFGDFLEMAEHLVEEGYKDAAAVIAGSTLEAHLRQLCQSHGIDLAVDEGRARKAESLNVDLAKVEVYSKLDQKSVTAWLGLRNNAAHGHYDQYETGQVSLLISGIRDFIVRNS